MPIKTIEELNTQAAALHARIARLDEAHAVLEIVGAFIQIIEDTTRDTLDAVETKLLHRQVH